MMRDKLRGNGEKLKDGFVRVAALTPKIKVADCDYNTERIIELIKEASQKKASLVVLPETVSYTHLTLPTKLEV